jgi:protein-L-isoaspartate(D-aspartate) O-methyltransferase
VTRSSRSSCFPRFHGPVKSLSAILTLVTIGGCTGSGGRHPDEAVDWKALRAAMVQKQLRARDITDERVLAAMEEVPRHEFVPESQRAEAYHDHPLPIGGGQTISQPYIVGLMTQLLELRGDERVLEIGTGSGYQAAVLARLCKKVYSIEIDPELAERARNRLAALGYRNVEVRAGDGFFGWPEAAPFDAILITAAAPELPETLAQQLAEGGRVVAPIGRDRSQRLMAGVKRDGAVELRARTEVVFVPMTGMVRRERPATTPSSQ